MYFHHVLYPKAIGHKLSKIDFCQVVISMSIALKMSISLADFADFGEKCPTRYVMHSK